MPFTSETARIAGKKGSRNGVRNQKSKAWEALSESITGNDADKFRKHMDHLWETSPDKAADLFLKTLEYFRPKQSRVEAVVDNEMIIEVRHVDSLRDPPTN